MDENKDKDKDKGMLEDWMKSQDPRTGKSGFIRFWHVILLHVVIALFGVFCYFWEKNHPYM